MLYCVDCVSHGKSLRKENILVMGKDQIKQDLRSNCVGLHYDYLN